ncbi:ankyrin-2-like isoform X36 [Eriocheir sinensis]|uniref:ankyrin-2-like isoform X36 n=1 Tax=Eriocheir sinensis TaxID=95602 RepID=UPI0021C73D31|nr:ankyrin-2-like isoform X36 [Eriocheir sinensis]
MVSVEVCEAGGREGSGRRQDRRARPAGREASSRKRLLRRRHREKRTWEDTENNQTDGSASFLRAARAGNLEKVLEFLKTNTDINTCNANGLNALHLASKEGHVNVVRELLQRGANVDAATKKGNTALHIASLAGQEEIVKVLVQHQALVNTQSQNGFTPLYMAAQENHDSVVRFLLANNANQSLATEDGFTPLAVALQQGHDKVVAVLLENDTRGKVRLPALHIAAKKDDTKAAALLLHTDHNPDVTSKSGFTPLHIASHYGNENIANLLIQRGADVNYIAKHQITPLHVASKWGKGNMVSLLIDKGANYEAKTRDGLTPLHCAARSGHEAVVDMLLEKGAPITSKTKNGLAPLHMASQGDHVDAARILLYHKAPVDDVTVDFLTALHVAAHCGHVRVAKLLLDRKAEPNARALNGFTPLHIACKKNRIKVVELLLKHGASIEATTESGLTPLHVASFMGCMNIVIYLLQHSAIADVPTVRGETPLHLAARANQTDIIRILLRNGAQVDARAREQQTALHIASRLGNSDIVVLLLQHGAAVDATTKDHYTALHIAAKEGQEEVASVLLEHGASLTSTTKKGFTPLHLAAKYGNMKVARLLLQKDAPVDAQGKNGVTPLHVAAHYDHQNVALLLLDKGASPHATAKNGYTPLHIASRKNQMDIATTLLEYGASANAESKAGFTPLHLSSQEGHTDMATLLIEHNAAAGACAKNGLTPLHLCGQEDRVNVAAILVKHGAQIDPATKAGYTPLHVACHFGQMNMVRFLLQHGAKVNSTTQLGYTPLHQAAQQGHTQIVNLLLENKAEPNTETNDGKTALSIAQRLGYISVVETLKIVTETTINTTTTTTTEEKYKVVVPETMHETFMSESEDEGGDDTMVSSMFGKPQHVTLPYYEGQFRYTSDDTMLGDQSYRYLTVDEMKSLGDDSLPIDVTKDEKMDMSFSSNTMAAPPVAPADQLSPQHQKEHYSQMTANYPADNVDVGKAPILAGPESLNTTLNTTIDSAMIEAQIEPQIIQTKLGSQGQQMSEQQMLLQNSTDMAHGGSGSEKATEILNGWEGVSLNSLASCLSSGTNASGMWRDRFLVSFMVDARGGAMRGCRHSGVRVIIPPRKAAMPMRVTCRYLKKDKLVHAPPLMEGEALGSCILEMGPAGAKFLGPVIIEVPHFASLRGKEREIVILRSDNGETWREHTLEATEEAVQEVLNESFDGEELKQLEDLNTNRITRILTTDFPQYFAIVTRIRQEVHAIGPEGGMVSSTVVPQVQAVFPQGALTKKIKVGLQAQPIPTDLVAKLLGNRVAVSPIVTVEPRRRKFHKPITLTIPVPQASSKGMINQYSGEAPTLRLLCSITGVFRKRSLKGGTTRAQWEDVTGSTPLTFVNDCVSFTTTVSARFWLMDCSNIPEATKMATELYREAIHVPFMAKFVVFSKRHQLEEARMRVFCMTDDREDKTLEQQELFVEVAKSRDVEVLEGKPQFLEFAGNLVPVTKSGDQLAFNFYAFRENRLPFTVRVKDQHADPIGRVAFMRQPKDGRWKKASLISLIKPTVFQVGRGDPPQTPICNLNIALPDNIQPEPAPSEPDLLALEKKYSFLSISKADTIHRASLRLTDISNMLGNDWVALAHELEISDSDINIIKSQYPDNAPQQAIVMLRLWMQTVGNKATGNTVGKSLRKIHREDIVKQCIYNVEVVTDDIERAMAKAHLDQSGFEAFKDELGPSRDATLNRDVSLDVSYDEQDMMKRFKELREAESAEEEEENQRAYHDGFTQASVESSQMSSTRGTADVSFPGADEPLKQLDGGTHEASQPTEQQTSLPQEEAASSHPTSGPKAGSDGGLHGGCPEAQGMDWEGKSVDSMLTETVMQARLSMLPAVDTNEGVALPSQPSSTSPAVASTHLSSPLGPNLPSLTAKQPQASSSQDPSENKSQTFLHLDPSHLHDSNYFEPQGFDVSPSSATKLSDSILLEKGLVCGAEASTVSHLVASPSVASLQSESFAPFAATEEAGAMSVTFNTSSAMISIGPISPTENSSEDHAEIDRTSTEVSPDSVRFDQDILDTRTEDEAPDLDDDLVPSSPVPGQELSERLFSIEATEDTDITTPMEMRDSHTERDTSASNLIEDKEAVDEKAELLEPPPVPDKEENNAYLVQEVNDIINKVNRLQEQVKSKEIDPITARSEIKVILNTLDDVKEVIEESKIEDDSEANVLGLDILSNIESVGEMVMQMMKELHLAEPEHSDFWTKDDTKAPHKTEHATAEAGSIEDRSPSTANQLDQSFSDLLDSEEYNRDSLEDEFDRLAADLSSPPNSDKIQFLPKATGAATAPSNNLSLPASSIVHPPIPPDAFQATQPESDVGVVFTERKEYGGGVKPSAETTGGHSHISPSPFPHPSQSIQSSSSASFQQKLPSTTSVNIEDSQSSQSESHVPSSRPSRRHERTYSQATNIFTGAIPTETKPESKKVEGITEEEQVGITEDIKPYSERKQFWETVTSQSFESKNNQLLKSETESDTDTGTDGTVLEQKVKQTKVSSAESNDSETEYLAHVDDPRYYENAGFAGTEQIDEATESVRERTISPFEVLRTEGPSAELPSPEDIAYKDVSSKRALFEKEIKRQSMEIEESQSWKRSSKEYDETVVVSEESASSTLKKKEERESKISETIEKDKEVKKKFESKKDDLSKTDFKTEITSKSDKTSSVEDRSEVTESSKLHQEKMQKKEEKITSEVGALGKSVTQRDASTEKREKETSEKEAKIVHEKIDSHSRTFSKSISKSEEKTESSSEAKETVHTLSTDDQDTSRDEMTEEDITRAEETSEEEPEEVLKSDKTTVDITEESRQLGDTRETIVRETKTTREGDQEQRVIKETKTQETAMADGSTIKTTSITTFTTQLETKDQEEPKVYSAKTAKEKAEAYIKQRMKSDIFSEELSSSAEDQSPEHKVLTPKDTIAPVSQAPTPRPLSSPILVPEENIEEVVWEVSQERSETVLSETVEDIPVQQSYQTQHVRDMSSEESEEKAIPEPSAESSKQKLSEEEARKLAIEIVEEVKSEAVKRSPLVTPSQTLKEFPLESEDAADRIAQSPLPIPIPESAFTAETTSKIEKYIQEQLGDEVDEKQLKLIESVTAKKTELLHRKLVGSQYQQSMEITDEDLRSSGAELSPIEHHMERLRQMTEEEDTQRYAREPSEADESESSIIIHDTVDDVVSSEYDQATQMISKTLDTLKTADISRIERPIDTIEELPETPVLPVIVVRERKMSEVQEVARFSDSDIKETARKIVEEVTELAKESEAVKQASLASDHKAPSEGQDQARSCSPKSASKPGSRKGSWMDSEDLTREFRKDYEDKKKMFKEEMTSDKPDVFDAKDDSVKVKHQKSSESQKEAHMESSMTESMEESSTVESIRSIEGKLRQEIVPEIREGEVEKRYEERSSSSHEEVVMRKKTHVEEFSRRSGTDFDACSSSGESHYFTAEGGTSDSRTASRPCSSDVEALLSERTGTSEYDTALTSQDTSQYSSYSSSSREYRTAASSMSSRDSMKSIDSESSGNLASVELSEASETLVPSAMELERDMDLLDQEIMEEDQSHSTQPHHSVVPQLTVQSDTPKSEDLPSPFDVESDEGDFESEEARDSEPHVASRMKRSLEMTFHPEPLPIAAAKKSTATESVASSLEESTLSDMSVVTVVEQERGQRSPHSTESSMTASGVSEQMTSSSEGRGAEHQITRTDSGVLTTDTGDEDMALHSVTITATSVPSTSDQNTASMCTQVTSETRSQAELTESEQFFHANGPTEVDYVPEYDDEVRGMRPVVAPVVPPVQEASGAVAGPSEGPQKVSIVEECYETEADQEYGQMMRESEYSDMAEAELQYSLEEQPEAEMSSMLAIEEPIERPKTPEPGHVPSSRPSHIAAQSLDEPEEFTEVDKRFSAIFSTTYEEREEGARSLVPGLSVDIPDIRVTEHTLPMPSQYCYPDLEREEDFPECQVHAEPDTSGQDIPATPGSQESASTCASRKSSSTDSEQGREYCLDDTAQGLPFESFEMVEAGDIDDFLEYEKTLRMHEKRMLEMSQIQEEEEEEIEAEQKVHTSPILIPSQLKAVKLDTKGAKSSDSQSQVSDDGSEEADTTIEEQRRWLELQFEESNVANFEYSQPPYMQHVYSGPLEDIEEEREDAERKDLSHVAKGSSLSSTPEYDVLAGRKFFTRSGEHDDVSMSSLQEFENLERAVAVEAVARRASSGSQESLNGRKPEGKSGQGDDISVGSFASLQEFERLEEECLVAEETETKAKEEEAMLSEIEEGHESQVSESESCETLSEPGRVSADGEEYDQRMFEIDEIIRQAQTNVEKFDKSKATYEGVKLQDLVSGGSSQADRTPSVGREEGDADSLEEAQLPELDLDHTVPEAATSSTKQDVMALSTDSIEASSRQKLPRETSQDSLEKVGARTSDPMATSVDSIDMASRRDPMTTSADSLEGRRRGQDLMSASTDSIDPCRRDVMATSIDSLGRDDSSGRDADISSGSEHVRPLPRDGLMECSADSLELTSSQATHAIYHQYDTDSVMSGSFTSGCSTTLAASSEEFPDMMTSSMYLPEGELPPLEGDMHHTQYMHTSSGSAAERVGPSSEPGFSHSVTRVVKLPPEAHQVTFTGPDAKKKLEDYIRGFNAGQHSVQDETVDEQGNVHIRRVTQTRIVADPERTQEHGFSVSEPSSVETEVCDEYGNVTRVIRRTVVTSHTIEVDLDTGEPIVQASSSSPSATSSTSASTSTTSTSSPSTSRIPRPVTSPPQSRSHPPGPPPGLRGPCEPVPPSLEPNTVSGLEVEEMSSVMESYASDGNDPITTTHITRYDPDPLPTTTSTTTTTTRVIRRTKEEDGKVKEEGAFFEEY